MSTLSYDRCFSLILSLFTAVLLALSPAAFAGKPAHAGGGGGGGGKETSTEHFGHAQVVEIDLHTALLGDASVDIARAELEGTDGGMSDASVLKFSKDDLLKIVSLDAEVLSAAVMGSGDMTVGHASVAKLDLSLLAGWITIESGLLQTWAKTQCVSDTVEKSGHSNLAKLFINGKGYEITGKRNQRIFLPGIEVTINAYSEQDNSVSTAALIVDIAKDHLLHGLVTAHIVISQAEVGILCGDKKKCPVKDFMTGGGQVNNMSFGFVGGQKAKGLQGHFNAVDHDGGPHLKGFTLVDYVVDPKDDLGRILTYDDCDGSSTGTCVVHAADHGEPGTHDHLSVEAGSFKKGQNMTIDRGNIQLHKPNCGSDDGGDKKGNNGKGPKK